MSTIATFISPPAVSPNLVWDSRGDLLPLTPHPRVEREADVAAIVVSRNRPDLAAQMLRQLQAMGPGLRMDTYLVEMGTDPAKCSAECTFHYDDPQFRGKCYGHNVGLRIARANARYRYYWILMNDLIFEDGVDTIGELVRVADAHPEIAVLSPSEPTSSYEDARPRERGDCHLVSTCDYLALLVRAECVDTTGFLNPAFKYCWGAIHELAYKLYRDGCRVAYCDTVTMLHLGGTTYGQAKDTPSRDLYTHRAKEFAARYFMEHYGNDWDEHFSRVLPPDIRENTFRAHRQVWESALRKNARSDSPREGNVLGRIARSIHQVVRSPKETRESLRAQIDALHPWYYDVEIGGLRVIPGIGSRQSAEELQGRVTYRTVLLVDRVAERFDFRGKRLLDVASNCAYWSARYAERGAVELTAIEGRADYVRQGELYWKHNTFLPEGAYRFIQGNVMAGDTWEQARERGPFDFTLCCGILYHVPDYRKLLKYIASCTREAVLIDTRVEPEERLVEEPGGWCFDAIIETREKIVPRLEGLTDTMRELGFEVEQIQPPDGPVPDGLQGPDDYSQGHRVTLLCRRKPA